MTPETMEWIKAVGMVLGSSAGAAMGNSAAARRAFRKLVKRVKVLETGRAADVKHRERCDAQHVEHRQRSAWAAGALHLVGSALRLRFGTRPAGEVAPGPVAPNILRTP